MDELGEAILDVRQAGLDRAEPLQRDRVLPVLLQTLGQRRNDIRISEQSSVTITAGAPLESLEEFDESEPITLPAKPIIEVEPEDVLEVPAKGSPVSANSVYEAAVPPGTSPLPGPMNCSIRSFANAKYRSSPSGY